MFTLLLALVFSGCSGVSKHYNELRKKAGMKVTKFNRIGYADCDKPIELSGFAGKFIASQEWDDLKLWTEYEKMTNVKINWTTVQNGQLPERRNLMMASNEYPEVLFATPCRRLIF